MPAHERTAAGLAATWNEGVTQRNSLRTPSGSGRLTPLSGAGSASAAVAPCSSKQELEKQLKEQFRQKQRSTRIKQVQNASLGRGLGSPATETLEDGYYNPQKVLVPLDEKERRLWNVIELNKLPKATLDGGNAALDDLPSAETLLRAKKDANEAPLLLTDERGELESGSRLGSIGGDSTAYRLSQSSASQTRGNEPAAVAAAAAAKEQEQEQEEPNTDEEEGVATDMSKYRQTHRPVSTFLEARMEVEENINTSEKGLDALCAPFTFAEVLSTLSVALEVVEKGDVEEDTTLAMCVREEPSYDAVERRAQRERERANPRVLHGAVQVMEFIRSEVFHIADELIASAHTAQWVLRYTITFLHTIATQSEEEAGIRVGLLARCVRILGGIEMFSSLYLSLVSRSEEYEAFEALQQSAEEHITGLLDDVERTLSAVLAMPFPTRRNKLQSVENGIRKKLQRALLFLNEIDYSWTPNVRFHVLWKQRFLSGAFERIHGHIAPRFAYCTLGFIDQSLYDKVVDSRITGRFTGINPQQAPKVLVTRQVEYERVTENLTFQQIGMLVKEYASLVVGHQLCMGARYALRKATPNFNDDWGFFMDEIDEKGAAAAAAAKEAAKQAEEAPKPIQHPGTARGARRQQTQHQQHLRDADSNTFITGV